MDEAASSRQQAIDAVSLARRLRPDLPRQVAQYAAPELTSYLTEPEPSYDSRLTAAGGGIGPYGQLVSGPAGKVPSTDDPRVGPAAADAFNLATTMLPAGGGSKVAMAMAPLMARGFFKPAVGEHIHAAAVKLGDKIYTGATHADALESAAKVLGRPADDILNSINASGQQHELGGFLTSSGRFVGRDEATKIADVASQLRRRGDLRSTQGSVSLPLDATDLSTPQKSSIDWLLEQINK